MVEMALKIDIRLILKLCLAFEVKWHAFVGCVVESNESTRNLKKFRQTALYSLGGL